jgi:hypothetical protein
LHFATACQQPAMMIQSTYDANTSYALIRCDTVEVDRKVHPKALHYDYNNLVGIRREYSSAYKYFVKVCGKPLSPRSFCRVRGRQLIDDPTRGQSQPAVNVQKRICSRVPLLMVPYCPRLLPLHRQK